MVLKYNDVLVIAEIKVDDTFISTSQFLVSRFSAPNRLDRSRNAGLIRDDIASRQLTKHVFPDNIKGLFIGLKSKS